jgi:hypothetical protein
MELAWSTTLSTVKIVFKCGKPIILVLVSQFPGKSSTQVLSKMIYLLSRLSTEAQKSNLQSQKLENQAVIAVYRRKKRIAVVMMKLMS